MNKKWLEVRWKSQRRIYGIESIPSTKMNTVLDFIFRRVRKIVIYKQQINTTAIVIVRGVKRC